MAVRRSIEFSRSALRRVFLQRCCYLFLALLALISASPFIEGAQGSYMLAGINAFIVLSAAAALGRTALSFLVVFCLIGGAVGLRIASMDAGRAALFNWALLLHALVYLTVIALLMRYVFGREVMDTDRLWGAAAAHGPTFLVRGESARLELTDLLYFSFSTLTTIGFGDIVPVTRPGQVAAILEGIVGTLFLAILIAKLVGVYPPADRAPAPKE